MMQRIIFLGGSLALTAALAAAQVPVYGQCGGIQYTGSTVCASGSYCTTQNAWYYQCVPGTAPATGVPTTTTAPATTTKSTTTKSTTSKSSAPTSTPGVKYFITFGDSYSQTGFDINSTPPSASNPEGNPPMPGWTTSGGLNWIGNLISNLNTSLILSYNFAYGGATTSASLVEPYESTVLNFDNQTAEFLGSIASHPSSAPWTAGNTLVGVWIGVNDVGNMYYQSNEATLVGEIMAKYFSLLQQIYNTGARNFVLLSVPPIDKSPLMLGQSASAQQLEASVITQYNDALASNLASFLQSHPGAVGKIVDTGAAFNKVINNPTAYGAADATCYNSDGVSCVWWNNYHPALAVHKVVAEAVAEAWKGSFW